MYKTLSRAFKNPSVAIFLRVATIVLLGIMVSYRIDEIHFPSSFIQIDLFLPLLLAGMMTMLNLSAEGLKYQSLFSKERISFDQSMRSVLAGMSVGIWTPNRAGEFLGRMRYAPVGAKKRSIGATILGSIIQGVVTLIMGGLGVMYFEFPQQIDLSIHWYIAILIALCITVFFMIKSGPINELREKHFNVRVSQIGWASLFAALRYMIFSSQFVILLFAFGFQGSIFQAFSGVFVLYAIQTYLPGSLLSELGVREVLAVFLFAPFFEGELGAALAAFCLWVLNIGLPITSWSVYASFRRVELR